jgi:hypothetical protein
MWSAFHFGQYVPASSASGADVHSLADALRPEHVFGEPAGTGEALNSMQSAQELESIHETTQDQPLLGLYPDGPMRDGAPSLSQLLAMAEASPEFPRSSPPDVAEALNGSGPPNTSAAGPANEKAAATESPTAADRDANISATDPGAPADREVDLFTKEASLEYRAGQAIARDGREFKIRGLRRGLAAFLEQAFLPRPIVVRYVLRVDKTGTPIEVLIDKSSGSGMLDQQIRKDLFNSWFDPDPSRTGRDLGKPFRFTIRIV